MKDTFKVLGYVVLFIPFVLISIINNVFHKLYKLTESAITYCASAVDTE